MSVIYFVGMEVGGTKTFIGFFDENRISLQQSNSHLVRVNSEFIKTVSRLVG
jgi:hypothetical protein